VNKEALFCAFFLHSSFVYADSIISMHPAMIGFLGDKASLEIAYFSKETPQTNFSGKIKIPGLAGLQNSSFSSTQKNQQMVGLYYTSHAMDGYKYGFALAPNLADAKYIHYEDPKAKAYLYDYKLDYLTASAYIGKEILPSFFGAFGLNILQMKATQALAHPLGLYSADIAGEGYAPSFTGSLAYKALPNFILALSATSKTSVRLKGKTTAKIGAANYTSNGYADTAVPAEISADAYFYFLPDSFISLGTRKRFWSEMSPIDMQFESPALEGVFGAPSKLKRHDTQAYRVSATHTIKPIAIQVGYIYVSTKTSPQDVDFTMPNADARIIFVNTAVAVQKDLSIGVKAARVYYASNPVYTEQLVGSFDGCSQSIFSLWLKRKF
jgi:hypothetical protein